MIARLKTRLSSDQGFTLIELLVVIIILGILLAIAVPSYLSFKDRANKSAAQANVRAVLPDVESYNADNVVGALPLPNGTDPDNLNTNFGYQGMTAALLKSDYDQAFPTGVWITAASGSVDVSGAVLPATITVKPDPSGTNYCLVSQNGSWFAWKRGPGGLISVTSTATTVCT